MVNAQAARSVPNPPQPLSTPPAPLSPQKRGDGLRHLKFLAFRKIASQAAHPLPGRSSPGLASALLKTIAGDVLTNSPARHHESKSLDAAMEGLEIIIL
jgi:hypothetical protein